MKILKVFILLIFCFWVFLESAWTSNSYYSEKECLSLTNEDRTYIDATKRILKLKTVIKFNSLLAKNKVEKVSMMFFYNEAKYINNKCFWYIRVEEDHQTHLAFWKAFLVDIGGSEIYEEDQADDSYHIIN